MYQVELVQLEKLLELTAKYGVKKLKLNDVEIEMGNGFPSIVSPQLKDIVPKETEIANEDMLFWSVNGEAPNLQSSSSPSSDKE